RSQGCSDGSWMRELAFSRSSRVLPPAAISLEAARRAPPDGVHPVHLSLAAPLADHRLVGVARPVMPRFRPDNCLLSVVPSGRFSHARHYRERVHKLI